MNTSSNLDSLESGRIVFLLDRYYPDPLPNGICVHKVALALLRSGYDVHIVAYRYPNEQSIEDIEGVNVHRIPLNLYRRVGEWARRRPAGPLRRAGLWVTRLVRWAQKLILLPWFPLSSPLSAYYFYRTTLQLHRKSPLSCVIAVFNPDETLFAAAKLKNRIPHVPIGAYILDSLVYLSGQNYLPPSLRSTLSWRFERRVYERLDRVYNVECHRQHHAGAKYDAFRSRMEFLDIPLFDPESPSVERRLYDSRRVHLVYLGSLYHGIREPHYLVRLFLEGLPPGSHQLHFYTRGTCEEALARYAAEAAGSIVTHGFVGHPQVPNIIANADVLLNIGVSNSTAISSKIFEYMSTGKPIVHLHYLPDDVNLTYLARYPRAVSLHMPDDEEVFKKNLERFSRFVLHPPSLADHDSEALARAFLKNTPGFTAERFAQLARSRAPATLA